MVNYMTGTKTYLVAAAMAAYGVGGYLRGAHSVDVMMQWILNGAGIAGLRHGIKTEVQK